MSSRLTTIVLLLLLPLSALAQQTPRSTPVELKVRVIFDNDRPVESRVTVQLLMPTGAVMHERIASDLGQVEFNFFNSFPNSYRLRVKGRGIVETTSGVFNIDPRAQSHWETVRVHIEGSGEREALGSRPVTAADLNIPDKARKEYDKGAEAIELKNWVEAEKHLQKAIASYERYAAAHNDLGVVYMNMGSVEKGKAAFEKAVEINDRYTRAYVNLARLAFSAGGYTEAEELLDKAIASEPMDVEALALLAQAQLMAGKMDAAIINARKVHELPHEKFALVHLIAAHCFQAKRDVDQAMVEYQIFLREDPKSDRASRARAALETLQKTVH